MSLNLEIHPFRFMKNIIIKYLFFLNLNYLMILYCNVLYTALLCSIRCQEWSKKPARKQVFTQIEPCGSCNKLRETLYLIGLFAF